MRLVTFSLTIALQQGYVLFQIQNYQYFEAVGSNKLHYCIFRMLIVSQNFYVRQLGSTKMLKTSLLSRYITECKPCVTCVLCVTHSTQCAEEQYKLLELQKDLEAKMKTRLVGLSLIETVYQVKFYDLYVLYMICVLILQCMLKGQTKIVEQFRKDFKIADTQ